MTAPPSSSLPPEAPHQPKWRAEELAKEKQGVVTDEDVLKEIIANPDRFQSQAVVAASLAKDDSLARKPGHRVPSSP